MNEWMNEWCFRPWFCTVRLYWARDNVMKWILLWIIPLVQDRSLDLLTSNPACYHCTTDAPSTTVYIYCKINRVHLWPRNTRAKQMCGLRSHLNVQAYLVRNCAFFKCYFNSRCTSIYDVYQPTTPCYWHTTRVFKAIVSNHILFSIKRKPRNA